LKYLNRSNSISQKEKEKERKKGKEMVGRRKGERGNEIK
jgi:hypothetical protein